MVAHSGPIVKVCSGEITACFHAGVDVCEGAGVGQTRARQSQTTSPWHHPQEVEQLWALKSTPSVAKEERS